MKIVKIIIIIINVYIISEHYQNSKLQKNGDELNGLCRRCSDTIENENLIYLD